VSFEIYKIVYIQKIYTNVISINSKSKA